MTERLAGKVAVITGAGTGLGEAIAHKFVKEGAKVVINGLPDDPIHDVAAALTQMGGAAIAYPGDVSEAAPAQGCVQAAIDEMAASPPPKARSASKRPSGSAPSRRANCISNTPKTDLPTKTSIR